ncbi:protease [Caballeronia sp. AZ10_KS36]|uniref:protease n=1 Tax=Caballeronia sp. AZ10_KS36 TaxID=2921757 RepID=UPI002028981A|nr:protease [Caballeronia sp. AZ10_KS36]
MADPTTEGQAVTATTASDAASPATAPASQAATPATQPAEGATLLDGAAKPTEGDAPKAGDKPADAAQPIEYTDFNVPEGVQLQGEVFEELKAFAKEKGLSQEDAQKLVDLGVKQSQGFNTGFTEAVAKAETEAFGLPRGEWEAKAKADPEFGGEKLGENLAAAKLALDKFGSDQLRAALNKSGLGNYPEMIRFMVKAGKAISEDGRLVTGAAAQKDRSATPIENRIYPDHK